MNERHIQILIVICEPLISFSFFSFHMVFFILRSLEICLYMYKMFFMYFWVVPSCSVFVLKKTKNLKPKKT